MSQATPTVLTRAAADLAIWLHVTRGGTVDFGGPLARDRLPGVLRQIADHLDATTPPPDA